MWGVYIKKELSRNNTAYTEKAFCLFFSLHIQMFYYFPSRWTWACGLITQMDSCELAGTKGAPSEPFQPQSHQVVPRACEHGMEYQVLSAERWRTASGNMGTSAGTETSGTSCLDWQAHKVFGCFNSFRAFVQEHQEKKEIPRWTGSATSSDWQWEVWQSLFYLSQSSKHVALLSFVLFF